MIGMRLFFVIILRSIDFNLMIALGVGWGMENLNYKFIMWVKQLNTEVMQFLRGLPVAWITCARWRRRWHKLCILEFFKVGSWRQLNGTISILLVSYSSMRMILNMLQNYSNSCCQFKILNFDIITWPKSNWAFVGTYETEIQCASNISQRNASIVGACASFFPFHYS